jgi:hypothetical protein
MVARRFNAGTIVEVGTVPEGRLNFLPGARLSNT